MSIVCTFDHRTAAADEKTEDRCWNGELTLEEIPIGNIIPFLPGTSPLDTPVGPRFITTRQYNNTDRSSNGYGHTGLDITSRYARGTTDIRSIDFGKVVLRVRGEFETPLWGEHVAIATRVSEYSEQILTHHYAHLYTESSSHLKACQDVIRGAILGKEGNTGNTNATSPNDAYKGVHLHFELRLWNNIAELNRALRNSRRNGWHLPGAIFGKGYWCDAKSCDPEYLQKNKYLHPYYFFTDRFLEFECPEEEGCPRWARPYALLARHFGIDFGRHDGYFAVNHNDASVDILTRREAARWLKVAKGLPTRFSSQGFLDMVKDPYVETLLSEGILVRSEDECRPASRWTAFCPSAPTTKGEFIKWVVKAFLATEFQEWKNAKTSWWPNKIQEVYDNVKKGEYFQNLYDQDTDSWQKDADYILFAAFHSQSLISVKQEYNPADIINKLEGIKILMTPHSDNIVGCHTNDVEICAYDEYCCDNDGCDTKECTTLPGCEEVPKVCNSHGTEVGGGSIEEPACADFVCNPGEKKEQPCGMAGTQTQTCNSECQWDPWGSCEDQGTCVPGESAPCGNCGSMACGSEGSWGTCQNEGGCTPGESQTRSCGTNGTQTATCTASCEWEPWSTCDERCVCLSGQCCDGCHFLPTGQVCSNGYIYRCQGPNPGQDLEQSYHTVSCSGVEAECTVETNSPWSVLDDCSLSEICDERTRSCIPAPSSCTASSYWSPSSASDTDPTGLQHTTTLNASIRVEVRHDTEGSARLETRVCKGSGTFDNSIAFMMSNILDDPGHLVVATLNTAGAACSPWLDIPGSENVPAGEVFGGNWQVISPASSRADWNFPSSTCGVTGSPGGTCWNGTNITLTRTCR